MDQAAGEDSMMLPGFRFHPTDEELVAYYLRRKLQRKSLPVEVITQLDIYKFNPWDLPRMATIGEKEWYFFCPRDRKYRNSARPNRVTGAGFWKATGTDRPIYAGEGGKCIGLKKSLVFYKGRAAKGTKTDWMMHEFRLPTSGDSLTTLSNMHNSEPSLDGQLQQDGWAVCRIFKKSKVSQRPNNTSDNSGLPRDIGNKSHMAPQILSYQHQAPNSVLCTLTGSKEMSNTTGEEADTSEGISDTSDEPVEMRNWPELHQFQTINSPAVPSSCTTRSHPPPTLLPLSPEKRHCASGPGFEQILEMKRAWPAQEERACIVSDNSNTTSASCSLSGSMQTTVEGSYPRSVNPGEQPDMNQMINSFFSTDQSQSVRSTLDLVSCLLQESPVQADFLGRQYTGQAHPQRGQLDYSFSDYNTGMVGMGVSQVNNDNLMSSRCGPGQRVPASLSSMQGPPFCDLIKTAAPWDQLSSPLFITPHCPQLPSGSWM